ncbi:hypothetical protein lerEdw1_013489 [Lerista edwardsae]|nr:hypothetical protein lerEdw1_013491 [Lerista edwardsae]KAJ6650233.1 hypothetical protein lerEdw1_013489 [Lerista edwardsae]
MAAVPPVSEELNLVVLGNNQLGDELAQSYSQEPGFEDSEATLPWGQRCQSLACEVATLEAPDSNARPSPEGSREDASVGGIADDQPFKFPADTTKEEEDKEEDGNRMPEVAAHVFVPISPRCIARAPSAEDPKPPPLGHEEEIVRCEKEHGDPEKQNFVNRGYSAQFDDLPSYDGRRGRTLRERLWCFRCDGCSSANLKAVASMMAATIIFPCLVYGAYVFLPFDVPFLPSMSSRLVYTLRCGVFATFPIVIGMVVYGVSRLCFSSLQPFGELRREVEIHRRYVTQSVHLFILYFFNLAVLATYLPQEALKLVPLLTALFALSRLLYWLAFAMGRSFRGFGFGLTFLPLVVMLLFNLYSMFIMDPENMFAMAAGSGGAPQEKELATHKPRFWG